MSVTLRRLIYRDAEALLRFVEPPMYPPSYLDEPLGQCLCHVFDHVLSSLAPSGSIRALL